MNFHSDLLTLKLDFSWNEIHCSKWNVYNIWFFLLIEKKNPCFSVNTEYWAHSNLFSLAQFSLWLVFFFLMYDLFLTVLNVWFVSRFTLTLRNMGLVLLNLFKCCICLNGWIFDCGDPSEMSIHHTTMDCLLCCWVILTGVFPQCWVDQH